MGGELIIFKQDCQYVATVSKVDESIAVEGTVYGTNFRLFFVRTLNQVWIEIDRKKDR
jgi:hypothetical protein